MNGGLCIVTVGSETLYYEIMHSYTGFPQIVENLENVSGHGKVMEYEKLTKSHGI